MRAVDAWAIETKGMPSLDLMERAGEGLAHVIAAGAPAGRIAIVCGKGNNGGDGLVAARLLRAAGREVDVLAVWGLEAMQGDAQEQLRRLPGLLRPVRARAARRRDAIVDALLGTGSTGAPRDPAAGVIEAINAATAADRGRRRAVGRRRLDRRGAGAGGPCRRDRHVPPRQAGAVDPSRQGPRRRRAT